jgi:hypothetical protein
METGIQTEGAEKVVILDLQVKSPKLCCILLVICCAIKGLLLLSCVFKLARFVLLHLRFPLLGQFLSKLCCILALSLRGVDLTSSTRCQEQIMVDLVNFLFELGAVDDI